ARANADEIAQLKAAAQALRDQMDTVRHDHEQRISQLQREARDEIKQLHDTIEELRDRMESAQRAGIAVRAKR
ncbi:MAG: hypothetical protein AAB322_00125, partial [Pseudomonadota bacterium]